MGDVPVGEGSNMSRRFKHFIDGQSIPSNSGEWIDSINPASGAVWAQIPRGNKADVDLAVEAAFKAYERSNNS